MGLPDDAERVAAVREAIGSWPALRIDANGAWSVDEAIAAIETLAVFDLELVEQPCATLEELAEVRVAVETPIAADEPIATAADVRRAVELGRVRRRQREARRERRASGPAREALRSAHEAGLEAWLSSTLDGPWGIAAALQLAASEHLRLASGLATLGLFDAEIARVLPPPSKGLLAVPQGPGLGVEVSADALAEVLVEELH